MNKFLKSLSLCLLSTSILLSSSTIVNAATVDNNSTTSVASNATNKRIVTYFPNWGIYQDSHQKIQVKDIAWDKVTHIHHGFFEITNTYDIQSTDAYADFQNESFGKADWSKYPTTGYPEGHIFGNFGEYQKYKELYPNVKVLVSVGGWTRSDKFHEMALTDAGRKTFANNLVKFLEKYPFIDGFDLDWEYPTITRASEDQYDRGCVGGPEDKENFTLLLKEIRETYNANNMKDKLLTVAVSAGEAKIDATEPDKYAQYVDYIGVMTYDFAGAWDTTTGHLAGIYSNSNDPVSERAKFNMDDAMKIFSEKYKVPKDKLLGGTPLYSRGWGNVEAGPNGDGLFQAGDGKFKGDLGEGGQYGWFQLKKMENTGGWKKYTDPVSKVPYMYNASTKQFLTYEDENSLQERINYINQNGYGGLIVWDASGDDISAGNPMHTIMYNGLIKGQSTGGEETPKTPIAGTLSVDKASNEGNYVVSAKVPSNSNATSYKLYENSTMVKEGTVSTSALDFNYEVTNKAEGTYKYTLETINASGKATSNEITVTVKKAGGTDTPTDSATAAPAKPTLSHNAWSGTPDYTISMNVWWGENGSSWNLYENGKLISTKNLTYNGTAAQSDSVSFTGKAKGTYTYKAELVNSKGVTASSEITVTVN